MNQQLNSNMSVRQFSKFARTAGHHMTAPALPWTASAWTPLATSVEETTFRTAPKRCSCASCGRPALDIYHSICPVARPLPWESRREIFRRPGRTSCNPEPKCPRARRLRKADRAPRSTQALWNTRNISREGITP